VAAGLVADALEALGCDPIFLESPGLGRSEVELIRRSHTIVLVLAPDEALMKPVLEGPWLQGADLVVLNHADREEAPASLELLSQRLEELAGGDDPKPLIATNARRAEGLEELQQALDAHAEQLRGSDGYERRRRSGVRAQLRVLTEQQLLEELWEDQVLAGELDAVAEEVARLDLDPLSAAAELARRIRGAG
jgi:LAO/AO transport system kinase